MNVLLIKPGNLSDHIQPSLALGYLAAQVRKDHRVRIVDLMKEDGSPGGLAALLADFHPGLVGIQCYSMDLPRVETLLRVVKAHDPAVWTIIGGAHPTAAPARCLEHFGAALLDFVFSGEAERGFPMLLAALEEGQGRFDDIPGLGWRDNGAIRLNQPEYIEDLDALGMPAWDLIAPERYPFSPHGVVCMNQPVAPVMATRGCPYRCTFCSTAGQPFRKRSAELFLAEVQLLREKHGIREFHMVDDNFTMDMDFARELLEGLIRLDFKASWSTPNGVRLERLDREIIELMKRAGFYSIAVGIESGSDRVRKLIRKGSTTDEVRRKINMVREAGGIEITGFFMLGIPGETREDIEATLRFSRELPLHRAAFHSFLPLPGTTIWQEMEESGEIDKADLADRCFFWAGAYVPRGMTRGELRRLHRKAFLRFYLRPRILLANGKYLLKPRVMKHALKYLLRRFGN
jgi:radical SAM superfamily enzyme YgiQ (UPF0313 family)